MIQSNLDNKLFFICNCKSEILHLEYNSDIDMVELSMFSFGTFNARKMSFRDKCRYIWRVLIKGTPYTDYTMLDRKQIDELKTFLNTI